MTPAVAAWACKAAHDVVAAVLAMFPEGRDDDPLSIFRGALDVGY